MPDKPGVDKRDCGCRVTPLFNEHHELTEWEIDYCPMHKAGPQLLEALKSVAEFWAYGLSSDADPTESDLQKAEELGEMAAAAIAAADPEWMARKITGG